MKKSYGKAYIVLGIVFAIFNIITFLIPTEKTSAFWVAYMFTVLAFASQIIIWKIAFKSAETLKSKFLGIPLISVGITYLIIQLIAFAIFMALSFVSIWIVVVTCSLILGISSICLISTEVAKEEIIRVEEKIAAKVFHIKALQVDIEMLAEAEKDLKAKEALAKLARRIRFSDPMSNDALADIEAKIFQKVEALKSVNDKDAIINELNLLVTERNKKTKLLK